MRICAVIPARGGSKGVPGKNLALIGGKSLLRRTVEAALAANSIESVFVSSDDPRICAEAERFGASVIVRPPDLSTDEASSEAALLHALTQIEQDGAAVDVLVFLQCTSPFTTAADIDGLIELMLRENADSALTVADAHQFLWRLVSEGGEVEPLGHEKSFRPRRQDRAPQYSETGAVYGMRVGGFRQHRHRFFGKTVAYVTDSVNLMEIDTPFDLDLCRHVGQIHQRRQLQSYLPTKIDAVLFDFDGVMTDDRVFVDETGREMICAHRGDGLGIEQLRRAGYRLAVISKEKNPVVQRRCEKLQIECIQGVDDKASIVNGWAEANSVALENVIFVGNDINDLPAAAIVGCSFATADAHPAFRSQASAVLTAAGGRGAVRSVCDLILGWASERG